jgi:hypothetical protein
MTTTNVPTATETTISPFLKAIAQQIRANDAYGTYRNWSDELLVKPYIVTKAQKREISVEGEVDPITKGRILAFDERSLIESKEKPDSSVRWSLI